MRTALIEQLRDDPDGVDTEALRPRLIEAVLDNRGHEYVSFAGQSVGLTHEVEPVAAIVARLIAETEAALTAATRAVVNP